MLTAAGNTQAFSQISRFISAASLPLPIDAFPNNAAAHAHITLITQTRPQTGHYSLILSPFSY